MRRILLVSNSTMHGEGYLDHCAEEIRSVLSGRTKVLFIPFALRDWDAYEAKARDRFARIDLELASIHHTADPRAAAGSAEAFFIGGGNTFRLLTKMYELDLIDPIRRRVESGSPYVGSSAGSNVATASIKTTNDMPIVYPPSFDALKLVPFNINPHYLDPDPASKHMGETRETRIREFHEMNDNPVVGLREGAWLRIEDQKVRLSGTTGARLFLKGEEARELRSGETLDFLLRSSS